MKTSQWFGVVILVALLCFIGGYQLSASTGTEPGYFAAVEAAGYGGGGEKIEGVSTEMEEYYKSLTEE